MPTVANRLTTLEQQEAAQAATQGARRRLSLPELAASLPLEEHERRTLIAAESAAKQGAFLNRARCVHHVAQLLSQGTQEAQEATARAVGWTALLVGRQDQREHGGSPRFSWDGLLTYLAQLDTHPEYLKPGYTMCSPVLLRVMYPLGVSPERLAVAEEWEAWPKGRPLPPCPVCHPEQTQGDGPTPLRLLLAACTPQEGAALRLLGRDVAMRAIGDTVPPPVLEQARWVRGLAPIPQEWRALVELALEDAAHQDETP